MALKGTAGIALVAWLSSAGALGGTCQGQSQGNGQKDPSATQHADVSVPGVDTSILTPRERKEWSSYVTEFLSPCSDTPVPIAQCIQEHRNCSRCVPAAKFVLKGVRDGLSREQIEKSYHGRFDSDRIKNVPVDESPSKGPASAPITIIEFADFECPFCAMMAPQLEDTFNKRPKGQIRFVYKFYPLPGHAHGEIAARAGVAAMNQGKFWEMHDKMFANRDHLEQSDLDSYAKDLGLDIAKFHADMQSPATTERLAKDKKLGETLEIKGTPTIYINGRDYDPHQDINDWLNLELSANTPSGSTAVGAAAPAISTLPPTVSSAGAKSAAVVLDAGKQK